VNQRAFTLCAALACAAFAIALSPVAPSATAGFGYDLDPEAQLWYDFAHDKAQEINHLHIRYRASLDRKHELTRDRIARFCVARNSCAGCEEHYRRIRKAIARRAKFEVGKCVWEAQMELDACYGDARAQLEEAGYDYFVLHIYSPYRTTQRRLIDRHRYLLREFNSAADCNF
jgi:hypothetical protein